MIDARLILPPSHHAKARSGLRAEFTQQVQGALAGAWLPPHAELELLLHCHGRWRGKQGQILRRDLKNLLYVAEDTIFDFLRIDDSHNFRIVIDKREDADHYVRAIARELTILPPEGV